MKMCFLIIFAMVFIAPYGVQAAVLSEIIFPVQGSVSFQNDFGDPRSGGRTHEGIDILSAKHTPVVAVANATIEFAPLEEPTYGWIINLKADDGYRYVYIHLNNDTPGTDDGMGGRDLGIVHGVVRGARVTRGQVIGFVGDSGNAEQTDAHLHFEMRTDDAVAVNPYDTLRSAFNHDSFDADAEQKMAESINADKRLIQTTNEVFCKTDSLLKSAVSDTVYYCGHDGKRYAFPNRQIYFSWYKNFDTVITVSVEGLAQVPFGGVITYKPGVRLVKIQSVPKVYAVADGGTLRWIQSPEIAQSLFGNTWPTLVDDLPDGFFSSYHLGDPVTIGK